MYLTHCEFCFSSPRMFGLLLRSSTPSLLASPMSSRQMRWDYNQLNRLGSCHTVRGWLDWIINTCQLRYTYVMLFCSFIYIIFLPRYTGKLAAPQESAPAKMIVRFPLSKYQDWCSSLIIHSFRCCWSCQSDCAGY